MPNLELAAELDDLDDNALMRHYAAPEDADRWLRVNFVTSVDGAVSVEGQSAGLSGPADKRVFKLLRKGCDALLVGAGTVRVEGYRELRLDSARVAWRREHGMTDHPVQVVVSQTAELDPAMPLFAAAPVRPIVLTCAEAPRQRRSALAAVADVITAGEHTVDFTAAAEDLARRGLRQILCEGGPQILGALTAADLVDELCLTVAPVLAGAGVGRITAGPPSPVRAMRLAHVLHADGSLLLRYLRCHDGRHG